MKHASARPSVHNGINHIKVFSIVSFCMHDREARIPLACHVVHVFD